MVAADINDGSRLVGAPSSASFTLNTSFAKMDVAWKDIRSIDFTDAKVTVSVSFQNGDRLTGSMDLKTIDLRTVFGDTSIGLQQIKRITVQNISGSDTGLSNSNNINFPEKVLINFFKRKKVPVTLEHKKHIETLNIKCETCHHRKKSGEHAEQTKCSDLKCHAKKMEINGKIIDGNSPKDNIFHETCLEKCHKKYKEKVDMRKCIYCHPK